MRVPPLLLLAAFVAASASAQQPYRVPRPAVPLNGPVDVDELLRLARVSQTINARTYFLYSFRQTSRTEELNEAGEVKKERTQVYRVIPSRQGTVRHLLEQDGEEPSARQVKKQHARNEKLRKRWEKIRAKQEKANAKKLAEAKRRRPAQPKAKAPAVEETRVVAPPVSRPPRTPQTNATTPPTPDRAAGTPRPQPAGATPPPRTAPVPRPLTRAPPPRRPRTCPSSRPAT